MKLILQIFLIIISTWAQSFQFAPLDIRSVSNKIINTAATYSIFYNRKEDIGGSTTPFNSQPLSSTSTLTLTFPSAFSNSAFSNIICKVSINYGNFETQDCSIVSNLNKIVISGLFTDGQIVSQAQVTIQNVINPSPAITTNAFIGTIGNDYSNQYYGEFVELEAAEFQSCQIAFSPATINTVSAMIVTLNPRNQIPQEGYVQLNFEGSQWQNQIKATNLLPIKDSMACSNYSSNINSVIVCSGSLSFRRIIANNIVSTPNTQPFTFSIQNFLSPPTTQALDKITITSYSSGNEIDICESSISGLIAKTVTSFTITGVGGNNLVVNRIYTLNINIRLIDTLSGSDFFTLEFPADTIFTFDSTTITGTPALVKNTANYDSQSRIVTLYMSDPSKTYNSGTYVTINIGKYTAPPSISPTEDIKLTIYRVTGKSTMTGTTQIIAQQSQLTSTFSVLNQTINALTTYQFSITIGDLILSSGKIKIKFPTTIGLQDITSNCAIAVGTQISSIPTCSKNLSENSITLTSINQSSSPIPPQTFTISIQNIKNPQSATESGSISISTYYSSLDSDLTSTGYAPSFTPTSAIIYPYQVSIIPSQYIVNQSPVSFTFEIQVSHPIPIGGYFLIYIPNELKIDENTVFGHCQIKTNGISFRTTSCHGTVQNATYSLITFDNPFLERMQVGSSFTARVKSVFQNPDSTAPTPSFGISIFYTGGSLIAKIQEDIPISMNTPASFIQTSITRASDQNQILTQYQFIIRQQSKFQAQSLLFITFPTLIKPSSSSACLIKQPISQILTCTYASDSNTIQITLLNQEILSEVEIIIQISQVKNPPSFKPISSQFIFETKTPLNIGNYYYSYGTVIPSLQNSIPTQFSELLYEFNPRQLGEALTLDITFKSSPTSVVEIGSIRVTISNQFIMNTLTCSSSVNIEDISCNLVSANSIQISGVFDQQQLMKITISGFQSPFSTIPTSAYSSLVSFDKDGFKIDQSISDISFNLSCTWPCKKCSADKTTCLSCYDNTEISLFIYYDSVQNRCYKQCIQGKYQTSSLTCQFCASNCNTCDSQANFCTSCKDNQAQKFLYIQSISSQICVQNCPQTYYPQESFTPIICTKCVSPCLTCSDVETCLSCISGTYFLNNTCDNVCPDSYYIKNSQTNECDPCDQSCVTCDTITTKCTSCKDDELLYLDQCILECPGQLVPQNNTCGTCDQSCLTCEDNPFRCTSCDTSSVLPYLFQEQFSCLSQCPDLYYQKIDICLLCSTLTNRHCSNCSSQSVCHSCDGQYILFEQSCVLEIPDGYINISNIAVSCQEDCQTCQFTPSNCTSCKTLFLLQNQCISQCPSKFIGLQKQCEPCQSPCKTCQQLINQCTSCLTTLNPEVYLSGSQCLEICPDETYASNKTNVCQDCISPCLTCTSATGCLSCVSNYFKYENSCVTDCPSGYVGLQQEGNGLCKICLGNCATCQQTQNSCLTCKSGAYRFQSTCLYRCQDGYYESQINKTCQACPSSCKTCQNTANCLSCLSGSLYDGSCLNSCPQKYYSANMICRACPTNCSDCRSETICTGCIEDFLLYLGNCLTQCPSTYAVVINSICTRCTTEGCQQCNSGDYCLTCISGKSLLLGICYQQCPAGYQTNGTHCEDTNQIVLTSDSSFPVPFTIATAIVFVACLMSKLQFNHTFMPGAVFALLGILEWGALVYYLVLYNQQMMQITAMPFFLGLGSLLFLFVLNIFAVIIQNYIFCHDKHFTTWNKGPNRVSTVISNIISTVITHKFRNILFCKLFTFSIFMAQLEDTSKFRVINVFSFLSLLHSGAAIAAAIFPLSALDSSTQLFYEALDVIIVTGINIPLAFFNIMKGKTFFYERTIDGYDLKKKNQIEGFSVEDKLEPAGSDQQQQLGFQSSFRHQIGSTQQLKFVSKGNWAKNADNQWQQNQQSRQDLMQKKWQQVSIQAVDMIDDDQQKNEQLQNSQDVMIGQEQSKQRSNDSGQDNKIEKKPQYNNQFNTHEKKVEKKAKKPTQNIIYKSRPKQQKKSKTPFSWANLQKKNQQVNDSPTKSQQKDIIQNKQQKQLKAKFDDIQQQMQQEGIDSKQIIFEQPDQQLLEHDQPLRVEQKVQENVGKQFIISSEDNQLEQKKFKNLKKSENVGKLISKGGSQIYNISQHIQVSQDQFVENNKNHITEQIQDQSVQAKDMLFQEDNNTPIEQQISIPKNQGSFALPVQSKDSKQYNQIKVSPNQKEYEQILNSSDDQGQLQQIDEHPLGRNNYQYQQHKNNHHTLDPNQFRKRKLIKTEMDKQEVHFSKPNRYAHLIAPQQNDRQQTEFNHHKPFGTVVVSDTVKPGLINHIKRSAPKKMMQIQSNKNFGQTELNQHFEQSSIEPKKQILTPQADQSSQSDELNHYYMNYFMQRPQTGRQKSNKKHSREKSRQRRKQSFEKSKTNLKVTEDIYMQKLNK